MQNQHKRGLGRTGVAAALMSTAIAARADYSAITDAVDWADVTTAIGVIFAAIAGVYVFFKGGKKLLSAIKGA